MTSGLTGILGYDNKRSSKKSKDQFIGLHQIKNFCALDK